MAFTQAQSKFVKTVLGPKFKLFLLTKLPAAFFSGVKVQSLTEQSCVSTIKHRWITQNPFKSTYFASLSMPAELSTGLPAFMGIQGHKVSMLVAESKAQFLKKATGVTSFTCNDVEAILKTIETAIETKEGQTITVESIGTNQKGETVAKFWFTWSFKAK